MIMVIHITQKHKTKYEKPEKHKISTIFVKTLWRLVNSSSLLVIATKIKLCGGWLLQ